MGIFFSSFFSASDAVDETTGISKSDRKKFDILKYDGIRAQRIGQLAYAISCFTQALAIADDLEIMISLVSAYNQTNEPEKALDVLKGMVEMEPERTDIRLTTADILLRLGMCENAIAECQRIIAIDPSSHLAYFLMSRGKKKRGDADGALSDLTDAIALKEDFADAYLQRAAILLAKADYLAAMADVEQVISLMEDNEEAYLMRGNIQAVLSNTPAAEADYEKVLELNPYNEEGALKLAILLHDAERRDDALEVLNDLIELSPSFADAYLIRGKIKEALGDAEGATADLKEANDLSNEAETEADAGNGQADFSAMYKGGIF